MSEKKMLHSEGIVVDQFCALRTESCPYEEACGRNYKKDCKPKWAYMDLKKVGEMWVAGRKSYKELVDPDKAKAGYEAHHILCIASVTQYLGKNEIIENIVKQTDWCINDKKNMIALPCFGQTVQWYCDIAKDSMRVDMYPPPFKNLPNHDFDHNKYSDEINSELSKLAGQIEEAGHKYEPEQLAERLDKLSKLKREGLLYRGGIRLNGTHAGWKIGMKEPEPDSEWYLPFSMAADGEVPEKDFVLGFTGQSRDFFDKVAEKINQLAKKL